MGNTAKLTEGTSKNANKAVIITADTKDVLPRADRVLGGHVSPRSAQVYRECLAIERARRRARTSPLARTWKLYLVLLDASLTFWESP